MSYFHFGLHSGHLTAKADSIARKHGAEHVNYTEPHGERRGWFCGPNYGAPHDQRMADAVWADVDRAGGIDALRYAKDRREDVRAHPAPTQCRPLHRA